MSRDTGSRRLYPVAVEPSASALFAAANTKAATHHNLNSASSREALPSYVALNFNFKPDSTHDCRRGALFQPGSSRSVNADWQLELEPTETEGEAAPGSALESSGGVAKRKPAHVFRGPQGAVKAYDLVLVWDEEAKVYRLDRIASAFSLKYERSKTTLSAQSHDVWRDDAVKAKKRAAADDAVARSAAVDQIPSGRSAGASTSTPTSKPSGDLKLKSKTNTVMAPVRRSSRRSLAVEMEEFEERSESPAESSGSASAARSKRNSTSKETVLKDDSKRVKMQEPNKERGSSDDPASSLRRSRRRSSQAHADETPESTQHSDAPAAAPKADEIEVDGDDDDLALELERELERELEVEMQDASESDKPSRASIASTQPTTKATSNRSLSPVSRPKRGERAMKINTPKAHTPDLDEASAYTSSSLSKSFKRSESPLTPRTSAAQISTSASIGLGLQQTGVGITPTASPHLDVASPIESSKSPLALEHGNDDDDDEEDDDLQDFAAELDMSLAEGPEPVPAVAAAAAAAPAVVEKRRSSRAHTAAQSVGDARPRQVRKAYGLGGPRQEEEELEDSD
ncbi:uncharacterized protein SRS1_12910 [Sporisorium reilianum f. sp. reilianum]|uniref:Transcription elongation factor Eaf N-terminal domain-containing protein n=1 Tax=Sporisorium reilianum f. sp. reilianum TaxID=72559 RepID=A0A2N8UA65_9BASI|nr:uncharacterized protein SRS1_12910 [Sporisorium reilianum f. sp. reilianum]